MMWYNRPDPIFLLFTKFGLTFLSVFFYPSLILLLIFRQGSLLLGLILIIGLLEILQGEGTRDMIREGEQRRPSLPLILIISIGIKLLCGFLFSFKIFFLDRVDIAISPLMFSFSMYYKIDKIT